MLTPALWLSDSHDIGSSPRCCEAIRCVTETLEAIGGDWPTKDARAIAVEVVIGIGEVTQDD